MSSIYSKMLHYEMIENKYTKWYFSIIDSYPTEIEEGIYCENHHIMPKCIENNNSKENIVCVRMKDHVILHHLLTKMFECKIKYKMMCAYHRIVFGNEKEKQSPIRIERAKLLLFMSMVGENSPRYGVKDSIESIEKRKQTWKEKMNSGYIHPNVGKQRSLEIRQKISEKKKDKHIGENNPNAKLVEKQIIKIYELWNSKQYTQQQIANMIDTSKSNINAIVNGHSYKNLYKQYGCDINRLQKLTEEQVREIKQDPRLYQRGGVAQIAREYGVHVSTISNIKNGVIWKHI